MARPTPAPSRTAAQKNPQLETSGSRRPVEVRPPTAPRRGSGSAFTGFGGATTGAGVPTGQLTLGTSAPVCADTLHDQAAGGCLEASSTPTLGSLYPLSEEFFVDAATGRVGLATTTPAEDLSLGEFDVHDDTYIELRSASDDFVYRDQGLKLMTPNRLNQGELLGFHVYHDASAFGLNFRRLDFSGEDESAMFIDRRDGFVGINNTDPDASVHARRQRAAKRDLQRTRITLSRAGDGVDQELDCVDLDDSLRKLAELNARHADVVRLRFLCSLTIAETAEALGVSHFTVEQDWAMARAWLRRELGLA